MKREIKTISGAFLQQSIAEIRKIRRSGHLQNKHSKKKFLEDKASGYFDLYLDDSLNVGKRDKKIFAEYIREFAGVRKDILLDKLQEEVDFNVRKHLETSSLGWWQRLFPRKMSLSSASMNRKMKKFLELQRKLNSDGFHGTKYVNKIDFLSDEAAKYIDAYNTGKFVPEDESVFRSYVKVMGNFYDNCPAQQALDKLDEEQSGETKIAAGRTPSIRIKSKRNWLKYAAIGAFVAVTGWLGLKPSSNNKKDIQPEEVKTEVKTQNRGTSAQSKIADENIWSSFAKKHNNKTSSESGLEQKQKDMKAFYAKRLTQFTSESRAQRMMQNLAEKVEAGIISLPEDISINRFLYAQQIYHKYGFEKIAAEFKSALNSDTVVAEQTQEKLFKYVREAGDKGVGVQKKALKIKNLKQLRDRKYKSR